MLIQITAMLGDGESLGERKKGKRKIKEGIYKLVNLS